MSKVQDCQIRLAAPTGMKANRYVTMNKTTMIVAYTGAGLAAEFVTIGDEENGVIDVVRAAGNYKLLLETGAAVTATAELEVGVDGKAITQNAGVITGYALTGAASGSYLTALAV